MGIVYRAREKEPPREVALKMLLPFQAMSKGMRDRFRQEIRAAASLDHPNILPVYRTDEHEELPYYTMKLAGGGTLAENLEAYRGRYREVGALVKDIAEAVHEAHEHGILHRDLKPGNLLFDEGGHCYVADFGLAKLTEEAGGELVDMTRTVALLGTPHYLPPEVARGGIKQASIGGDVYALGAILYELLTGHPPFSGAELGALLSSIAQRDPAPPSQKAPDVPRDLETICLKCLEKDPRRRYATARALAEDLERFVERRPIQARPVGRAERSWLWCRRNPVLASLGTTVLVLAAALGVGLWKLEMDRDKASQYDAALAILWQRMELDPADPISRNDYGLFLERARRFEEATGAFTEAMFLASRPVWLWSFDGEDSDLSWSILQEMNWVARGEGEGVTFAVTGEDPSIDLVLAPVDGRLYRWLHVRMRNHTRSEEAAVYWGTAASPELDESKKLIFSIEPEDARLRTYTFDLGLHDAWRSNQITRLRLDPVNGPTGSSTHVELAWVCLQTRPHPPSDPTVSARNMVRRDLWREALRNRARVLEALHRDALSEKDYLALNGIPPRPGEARSQQLDLTSFYDISLEESLDLGKGTPGKELVDLPSGLGLFDDIPFDIRGVMQLSSLSLPPGQFPLGVTNIPVQALFTNLHALMAVGWEEEEGREVGAFVLHYQDGQTRRLPIRYGIHVKDWVHDPGDEAVLPAARVAWTGQNAFASSQGRRIRLFHAQWSNPRPEEEVTRIDFISAMTRCTPFVVGLTVEP